MKLTEKDMHQYQRTSVEHVVNNPSSALFLDMGLGKTVSTLTAINYLIYEDLDIENVLVIAPKRVMESVWDAEIEKWEHLQHLTVTKITGTPTQRKAALLEKTDIHIISRDNIAWLCGQYGGGMLPYDMMVIDELSSFKNPKSMRFKALRKVQPSFKRVVGLTGTPAPNGLIDLWAQIYLLDRGERLGKFISHYRDQFFRPGATNGAIVYNYRINKGGEEMIYDKIGDICMSMKAEDYLTLPGRIENVIEIKFDARLQKMYNDFEKDQVMLILEEAEQKRVERVERETQERLARIREGEHPDDIPQVYEGTAEITAANAAALSNKLLQFANGAIYDEDRNVHHIHDLKIDELKDIIEDANGKPVLVAYAYKHDLDRILKALKKYKPVQLKTDEHIRQWNRGEIQVMVMHPASGGHGLNLQAGGNMIVWFGQTWSLELYQQFNARLDRQGQKNKVIIHKLIVSKTIDQRVVKALGRKADTQDGLMAAVKSLVSKYLDSLTK